MSLGLKKWNSPQFDSTILLLFQHGWIKKLVLELWSPRCAQRRSAAINFSLGYTGENWFHERKNYVALTPPPPPPLVAHLPVPLNCFVANFRATATILGRLRLPSAKGYSTSYIKMWDVEPKQYIISWYGTGGLEKKWCSVDIENTGRKPRNLITYCSERWAILPRRKRSIFVGFSIIKE